MDEADLIEACLPIFQDKSLDEEDQLEQAWERLERLSSQRGQYLENQRQRVFMRCREIILQEETSIEAKSQQQQAAAAGHSRESQGSGAMKAPGQSNGELGQFVIDVETDPLEEGKPPPPTADQPQHQLSSSQIAAWNKAQASNRPPPPSRAARGSTLQDIARDYREFVPGRSSHPPPPPPPLPPREAYETRVSQVDTAITWIDARQQNLRGQMRALTTEIQAAERTRDDFLRRYNGGEGRAFLAQGTEANDKALELRQARDIVMRELASLEEQKNGLYGDFPEGPGEKGPRP